MFIKIRLKTTETYYRKFPINLKDLEEAITECYLGLGTPYKPIPIDNFVDLSGNQFPEIPANAKITIKLQSEESDSQFKVNDPQLLCCKAVNVGRAFNNSNDIPKDFWKKVFKCRSKYIYGAPDGTLYISANKNNNCSISTKKKMPNTFVAYSIIFSICIDHKDGYKRRYYFILDPVLKISSTRPPYAE